MKADYGAVAYLSAWEPSYTDANHTFDKEIFKAVYDEGITEIGFVENWANIEVHNSHGSYGDANIRTYLWLGDPATDIWTKQPAAMSVEHPEAIILAAQDVEINVMLDGEFVEGARVCISEDYDILAYGFTDQSGNAVLTVEPEAPGELDLTVTAHNGLPSEGTIEVIIPGGAWIILDDFYLDDSAGGNGDGLADYGETVVIGSSVKNMGTESASNVSGALATNDTEVEIVDPDEFYGIVDPDEIVWGQNGFSFTVDLNVQDGHNVLFETMFQDSQDSLWSGQMAIILHAPVLDGTGARIDDSMGGNGDGKLDPGEEADLYIMVSNSGSGSAEDVWGQISTTDQYVTILDDTASFPDISSGSQAENSSPYSLEVDSACPDGHSAEFKIILVTAKGYYKEDDLDIQIGGFIDNIEDGEGDWEHYPVTPGYNDEWHISSKRNHTPEGSASWKCGSTGSDEYSDFDDSGLVTPTVFLGDGTNLIFWHWMAAELDYGDYAWDGGIVEISQDGGVTWTQIAPEGGYPYKITENDDSPFEPDTPCYSGYVDWEQETFDLSAYSGQARFRFRFGTDGYVEEEGWYIDDVQVLSEGGAISLQIVDAPEFADLGQTVLWEINVANSGESRAIDFWLEAEHQGGFSGKILMGTDITIPAGYQGESELTFDVPLNAPLGTYEVMNIIGEYPDLEIATAGFTIEILSTDVIIKD